MAVTKPNDPAAPVNPAGFLAQSAPDQFDTDLIALGFQASGVVSGCAVSQRGAGANMSVDVAAGTVEVAGTQVAVSSTNVAVTAADATNARIDLVVVTNAGVVSVVAGSANANPCDPAIPASRAVLAEVYVPAAVTSVITSYLTDKRVIIGLVSIANVMPTTATLVVHSQVTADTQDRFQLQADGTLLWGSGGLAQDTNLYRGGADLLQSDDGLTLGTDKYLTIRGSGGILSRAQSGAGNGVVFLRVSGDAADRLVVYANGSHGWGGGTASQDAVLDYIAAGVVRFTMTPGNAAGGVQAKLSTAGTTAFAYFEALNDTSIDLYTGVLSSTYSTSGLLVANQAILYTDNSASLLIAEVAAADIILTTGGTTTVSERLRLVNSDGSMRVTQQTVGNIVQRSTSIATNDDPTEDVYQNRLATADATQTTLHTVTLATGQTVMVVADVIARRTGGTAGTAEDGAGYHIIGTYKNVAGTATLIGAVSASYTAESVAAYDATLTVTGATVLLRVTGVASTNITWHATLRVYRVGT